MRGVLKQREERAPQDRYYTPQPLADEIVDRVDLFVQPGPCWDPCCGELAFVNAMLEQGARFESVFGTDLDSTPPRDFLRDDPVSTDCTLIISNPPFLLAEQFVRRALALVREGGHVAYLLRLSFLAGQRRLALYEEHPLRYLIPITPRPSFTPDGKTDASEYAVFVWQRGWTGLPEILPHIRWRRWRRE